MNQLDLTKQKIDDEQLLAEGKFYCEICIKENRTKHFKTLAELVLSDHHIIERSEAPKHRLLHARINIIRLCQKHHQEFHANKHEARKAIVQERNLKELFSDNKTRILFK